MIAGLLVLAAVVAATGLTSASATSSAEGLQLDGTWTSMWFFRSDPATGANLGTQEVDRTVRLSADGNSFTAVAVVQQFDVDGNPVGGQLHATEVGERLAINPNPDQP